MSAILSAGWSHITGTAQCTEEAADDVASLTGA